MLGSYLSPFLGRRPFICALSYVERWLDFCSGGGGGWILSPWRYYRSTVSYIEEVLRLLIIPLSYSVHDAALSVGEVIMLDHIRRLTSLPVHWFDYQIFTKHTMFNRIHCQTLLDLAL